MLGRIGALVGALCLASAAHADVAPSAQNNTQKVPQSIWQVAPDGTATHLQTTLICPPEVGDFKRSKDLVVYDNVGFDVSCGYNGRGGWITIYLTKLGTASLAEAFADAKRQLVQHTADAVPLAEADQKTFDGADDFLHLIYTEKNGSLWSGIWMTEFSGWMFEFRASYRPDTQAAMFDELVELTRRAKATAGTHLALCGRSSIPAREGTAVTDETEITAATLIIGATAFEKSIPVEDEKGQPKGQIEPARPAVWCAESAVSRGNLPILLWHAVTVDGMTQNFDRVTVSTFDASPELLSGAGDAAAIFDKIATDGKSHFVITMRSGDDVYFYGVYAGRAKAEELARIMQDFFDGHAKALAKVNAKTNTITVFQAPK